MLPVPTEKESVCVYLRIKPKTPEESTFYTCSDEFDMAKMEEENFEVVTIESSHQVRRDEFYFLHLWNRFYLVCSEFDIRVKTRPFMIASKFF
jgi:hypothetical protein